MINKVTNYFASMLDNCRSKWFSTWSQTKGDYVDKRSRSCAKQSTMKRCCCGPCCGRCCWVLVVLCSPFVWHGAAHLHVHTWFMIFYARMSVCVCVLQFLKFIEVNAVSRHFCDNNNHSNHPLKCVACALEFKLQAAAARALFVCFPLRRSHIGAPCDILVPTILRIPRVVFSVFCKSVVVSRHFWSSNVLLPHHVGGRSKGLLLLLLWP